jgi:predicted DNA-binding ribbon-helix-helix protein
VLIVFDLTIYLCEKFAHQKMKNLMSFIVLLIVSWYNQKQKNSIAINNKPALRVEIDLLE